MRILVLCLLVFLLQACGNPTPQKELPKVNPELDLNTRLTGVNFPLIQTDPTAVLAGIDALSRSVALPEPWPLQFAGAQVHVPPIASARQVGISHPDGRKTIVYMFPDVKSPGFGQFEPLARSIYRS